MFSDKHRGPQDTALPSNSMGRTKSEKKRPSKAGEPINSKVTSSDHESLKK